jgi:hypothetical protein
MPAVVSRIGCDPPASRMLDRRVGCGIDAGVGRRLRQPGNQRPARHTIKETTMAKSRRDHDLVEQLHASGIRKRAAELIADATDGRRKPAKHVRRVLNNLSTALSEAEDRVTGGPAKRKAAAKKAARTRKLNAAKRSASAKKAARTRAKRST